MARKWRGISRLRGLNKGTGGDCHRIAVTEGERLLILLQGLKGFEQHLGAREG